MRGQSKYEECTCALPRWLEAESACPIPMEVPRHVRPHSSLGGANTPNESTIKFENLSPPPEVNDVRGHICPIKDPPQASITVHRAKILLTYTGQQCTECLEGQQRQPNCRGPRKEDGCRNAV